MKATMKKIQAHIDEKYGKDRFEFVKGNGYFYFVPSDNDWPESIYAHALFQMDLERWIMDVDYSIDNSINQ